MHRTSLRRIGVVSQCIRSQHNLGKSIKRLPVPSSVLAISQAKLFSTAKLLCHKHIDKPRPGEEIKVTFILQNGERTTLDAPAGASILDVAHENDVDLEGACEGSVACSTCHVIVEPSYFEKLEEPTDEENDMLDLAFGLEETSRLGCQVMLDKSMDGITVKLPSATRNMQFPRTESMPGN